MEIIAIQLATSLEAINEYVNRTLLFHTLDPNALKRLVRESLEQLIELLLITLTSDNVCQATTLGKAIVASSLNIEDGLFVYDEIRRALKAFVLDGELHVFYMFTPIQPQDMVGIDWRIFYAEMEKFDESDMRVLAYVGIQPSLVMKL